MMQIRNLRKRFDDGFEAVKDITFTLQQGKFYALVGESGSGKSTLAQLLMGTLVPSSGEIVLKGKPVTGTARQRLHAVSKSVQLVLQDGQSALDPRFTVFQSIAEPMKNLRRLPIGEIQKRIPPLMDELELPRELLCRKPSELSGGQQKRVCIARALAVEPHIIIFDEAVSGLDVLVRKSILDLLKRLHASRGMTCLMITHDMDVALYLADSIMVMKDGCLLEQVEGGDGVPDFTHPYSRLLLASI